ncbi:MAG: serine hydrolase [Bacteroidota bacterium]
MKNITLQYFFLLCLTIGLINSCQQLEEPQAELQSYDAFLTEMYEAGFFNGNVLVFKDGKIVHQKAYGIGNISPVDSLKLNSQFRLASVSKQFTAMLIMILQEEGKLDFEQDLRDFIPELPYENVTIRHLLTHTSGLPDYEAMMNSHWKSELEYNNPARMISGNEDILTTMAEIIPPIDFSPGERWEYSNTGYVLLASIVARASGKPFEVFMKEKIFDPIGMNRSEVYKYKVDYDAEMPNRVFGYAVDLVGADRVNRDVHYLNYAQGDGGIYSTLADLLKWDRYLYENKLVSKETLEEAYNPATLNDGYKTTYGFGVGIDASPNGNKVISHSGGWVGFGTYLHREIEDDNTIIFLSNNSSAYFWEIINPLIQILHEQPYEIPKMPVVKVMGNAIAERGADAAIAQYHQLKETDIDNYFSSSRSLNGLGRELLRKDRPQDALKVFQLSQEEYPDLPYGYDGMGDAYLAMKDPANALITFKKAIEIDDSLESIKRKIASLQQ